LVLIDSHSLSRSPNFFPQVLEWSESLADARSKTQSRKTEGKENETLIDMYAKTSL
jgi:hypothetical protein